MRTARTTLATAVMSIALLAAAAPAAGGPSGHDVVYLVEQTGPSSYTPTENYVVVEGGGRDALIRREQHGTEVGQVDWSMFAAVGDDTATPHSDFHPDSGTKSIDPVGVEGVPLSTIDDSISNEPIETYTFKLSNARGEAGMILRQPSEAKISIIDNDGDSRIGLGTDAYSNFENRGSVRVSVVRAGDATAQATVQYATAPGTATAGSDYTTKTGTLTFEAGGTIPARTETIVVPLLNDSADEPAETFTLTLSNPTNATLTTPASATVTIEDDDSPTSDMRAPVTSFHIPRHGETYGPRSLEAKSVHISPSDEGSGVARTDFALRKKMRNGDCSWYTGTRFRAGSCSSKRWLDAGLDQQCPDPDLCFIVYEYDERLKTTTRKSGIRNYTAFARSHDNAGNVERDFDSGRNKNTFFIKRR